ncbi:MAG: TrmH family RNA methyltransferase [Clostridia bacterium]|nr:TrmH family RNA methyltransferase [Clostridia bacterium]
MPKLESYSAALEYSYCLGVFPSLNLLMSRPETVTRLLLHPRCGRNEGVAKLRAKARELGVREEEAERVLRREARKDNCYAALVFEKYRAELRGDRPHVVLCQISDQGNLGTALRACLGFGFEDVAVIRPCVDVFDPRALRASMGAFFQMNVRVFDTFDEYRALYPDHALYPFMLDGAVPLNTAAGNHPPRYALVFGNEQSGLPAQFAGLGQAVLIPQSEKIDSLNLAMAVSIGTYAFSTADAAGGRS